MITAPLRVINRIGKDDRFRNNNPLDIGLGPFFLTQLVAKQMLKQAPDAEGSRGRIVNITSISVYTASINRGDYCMVKAGLAMMREVSTSMKPGFLQSLRDAATQEFLRGDAVFIFAGLIVFNFFSEMAYRSPMLLHEYAHFIKKTIFPSDMLAVISTLRAAAYTGIGAVVMLICVVLVTGHLPWTVILMPLLFIPLMAFLMGLAWFLCAIGAFTRDAGYLMINVVPLFMFMTPVFFPHTALSAPWNILIYLNALTAFVEVMRDLVLIGKLPNLLVVRKTLGPKTVPELIALAKEKPGKIAYASSGSGTTVHLSGALFATMAKIDILHVPYRGSAPAVQDMLADQVDMIFDNIPGSLAQMAGGKVWGLAVTGTERSPMAPEVPTMDSFLPGFDVNSWGGICGPAGVPQPIVDKLNALAKQALDSDEVKKAYLKNGATPLWKSVPDTIAYRRAEEQRFAPIVKASGAKVD